MGCNCCRMIKSYINDPSVPVEVHGRKTRDPVGNSSYYPHLQFSGDRDQAQKKHGFYNLGYSSSGGLGGGSSPNPSTDRINKLDVENNHINRLHGNGGVGRGGGVDPGISVPQYREQPVLKSAPPLPSVPPVYQLPSPDVSTQPWDRGHLSGEAGTTHLGPYHIQDALAGVECCVDYNDDDEERESGVGSTPEYLGDTGDEASVLSGDINTSSTSLSSAETRPGTGEEKQERLEGEGKEDREDCQSVTDSMVAEALAALEAATAGEDYD